MQRLSMLSDWLGSCTGLAPVLCDGGGAEPSMGDGCLLLCVPDEMRCFCYFEHSDQLCVSQ
jgi:hypothetical protein